MDNTLKYVGKITEKGHWLVILIVVICASVRLCVIVCSVSVEVFGADRSSRRGLSNSSLPLYIFNGHFTSYNI
jgi:hypothetical protein